MSATASDRHVVPGLARLHELFDRVRHVVEAVEPVRETSRDPSRSLGRRARAEDGAASGHG